MMQRLQTASGHWMQTAKRAVTDSRVAVKAAYHNWHLGPTQSNPLYDISKLHQSVRILYRGYSLSVLGAQPVYAMYFGAYEAAKHKLSDWFPSQSSSLIQIAAGFLAECCAVVIWNPWEVIRQRMQLGEGSLAGGNSVPARTFLQTTQDIVSKSGVRGLYAGVGGYIALWGTFSPLMFVLYEQGMAIAYPRPAYPGHRQKVPSFGVSFAMGSFAGFVAAAITSPLDVVKTRMQTQTPTTMLQYTSVLHGLREIYTNEGPRALFRGTMARALNQGLAAGIMLGCYGTLRAQAARRLGYLPAPDSDSVEMDDGWRQPLRNRRLQMHPTHGSPWGPSAYDEGAWPTTSPEPSPTAAAAPSSSGWIR